jgi:hypothetical protein
MDKTNFNFVFFRKVSEWLKNIFRSLTRPFSNKRRSLELQELEEQFTKDSNLNSEQLKERQVSATIRSGRG